MTVEEVYMKKGGDGFVPRSAEIHHHVQSQSALVALLAGQEVEQDVLVHLVQRCNINS